MRGRFHQSEQVLGELTAVKHGDVALQ